MRPTSRQALTNDFGLKWARCLPHMGNVLAPVGQRACPTWARSVRDPCPKHVQKYQYGKVNRIIMIYRKNTKQSATKMPNVFPVTTNKTPLKLKIKSIETCKP